MTLQEMAEFVCGKVRQSDASAIARCKAYLRRRYEMIWQGEMWRDAVYGFPFTFTPDATDVDPYAKSESWGGAYLFPTVVQFVIAVRRAEGEIPNVAAESLYRFDPDWWAESGPAAKYVKLPACVAMLPEAFPHHDLRIYAAAADAGLTWKVVYLDANNNRITVSNPFSTTGVADDDVRVIERVTKPATSVDAYLAMDQGDWDLAICPAADTSFPIRQAIQFIPKPTEATAMRALVKKRPVPLDEDGAEPELNGVENCLMAFAQGDMLQRARQYGKAQAATAEAAALLGQLKAVAVVQENTRQQIIPQVECPSGSVDMVSGKDFW